jgi:hypothetical protein
MIELEAIENELEAQNMDEMPETDPYQATGNHDDPD